MKNVKSALMLALASITFVSTVQAGIHIKVAARNGDDACSQLSGHWTGSGIIDRMCKYTGTAVSSQAGSDNHYNIHVDLKREDGYFWCPKAEPIDLQGTCTGNDIIIDSPKEVHLTGMTDGLTIHLDGTVETDGKVYHVDSLDLNKYEGHK